MRGRAERAALKRELMSDRLPILTYHSLDDSDSAISIAPVQFHRQMAWLHANGWRTLRVSELLAGRARGAWPARSIVLTFDDGFQNFIDEALPILSEFDFTAIVFVVAGWVGRWNDWPSQPPWVPRMRLLGWDELAEVAEAGIEIGAHTRSHPYLRRLSNLDAARDIFDGKHLIEDQLGRAVETFAYPYGDRSSAIEKMVADHFRAGFSTRLSFATAASPLAALDRIDVYRLRGERFFHALESGWLDAYLRALRGWIALRERRFNAGWLARSHKSARGLRSA